jgi:hypothetical protein
MKKGGRWMALASWAGRQGDDDRAKNVFKNNLKAGV